MRCSEIVAGYRITLFTSPTPLRAGQVDVSVLVQDADTSSPVPDARVSVTLAPPGRPEATITRAASHENATNKLLQATVFDVPESGSWNLTALVEGPIGRAQASCLIEVAESWPSWLKTLPWIGWPVVPIMLFGIHQYLVWRRYTPGTALR